MHEWSAMRNNPSRSMRIGNGKSARCQKREVGVSGKHVRCPFFRTDRGLLRSIFGPLNHTSEVFTRVGPDNSLERITECSVGLITDQSSDFWELFFWPKISVTLTRLEVVLFASKAKVSFTGLIPSEKVGLAVILPLRAALEGGHS